MKIGLLTAPLGNLGRREAFLQAHEMGYDSVELGTGEFTSDHHAHLTELHESKTARDALVADLEAADVELAALSCHGNPVHPNHIYAARADDVFRKTVDLAAEMGVRAVNVFSGCPGDPDGGNYPNWITTPWPEYFGELLKWQWDEVLIPYWKEANDFAEQRGVGIAIEMHPGNAVYNVDTLFRLREACGDQIGVNFDPSHLWWQGMDPLVALRAIAESGALYNVHAKDTVIETTDVARTGILATTYTKTRLPWHFTTMGTGHDLSFWRRFVAELRTYGFPGSLVVEHEDELAPLREALTRSVDFLRTAAWESPEMGLPWLEDHDPAFPSPQSPWPKNSEQQRSTK